jgi:hypothetical protein
MKERLGYCQNKDEMYDLRMVRATLKARYLLAIQFIIPCSVFNIQGRGLVGDPTRMPTHNTNKGGGIVTG